MRQIQRFVAILLVCGLAGTAVGSARKVRMFTPQGSELASADGAAVLNYVPGTEVTIVQIMLTGFTPYSTYDLEMRSPTHGSLYSYSVLLTDDQGNAQFHSEIPTIDASDSSLFVYVNLGMEGEELRAVGLQ
jgi:hypothetical protein